MRLAGRPGQMVQVLEQQRSGGNAASAVRCDGYGAPAQRVWAASNGVVLPVRRLAGWRVWRVWRVSWESVARGRAVEVYGRVTVAGAVAAGWTVTQQLWRVCEREQECGESMRAGVDVR